MDPPTTAVLLNYSSQSTATTPSEPYVTTLTLPAFRHRLGGRQHRVGPAALRGERQHDVVGHRPIPLRGQRQHRMRPLHPELPP